MENKIKEQIMSDLKQAMVDKNENAKNALKGLLSAFTNELVSLGRTPRDSLSEQETISVIKKAVKQRKDAISQFEKGGRADLAESEKKELEVLEKYLPEMLSEDEILKLAEETLSELEVDKSDKSKMGVVIGSVMKKAKGNADGSLVKSVVEKLFEE